jgi:general secretion pathway protein C
METMITLRRGLLFVFVLCATFLLAHTLIAEALHLPTGATLIRPMSPPHASTETSSAVLAEQVRLSGLFPLPPDPMGMSVPGPPGAISSRAPLNVASKIKLLGVVIGERGGVSAIIEELSSKRQLFVRLHDSIPDVGEVSEIRRGGIVISLGDQQELLSLLVGQPDKPPTVQPAGAPKAIPAAGGPLRKVLDRREVDQALGDLPKLLSQARAVPYLVNGVMSGFRLDYIAPSSFYEKIGLQYGDVLQQVNGVEVRDPGTMLTLFQQLRNERIVKLDVLRSNQRTTMNFDIR